MNIGEAGRGKSARACALGRAAGSRYAGAEKDGRAEMKPWLRDSLTIGGGLAVVALLIYLLLTVRWLGGGL